MKLFTMSLRATRSNLGALAMTLLISSSVLAVEVEPMRVEKTIPLRQPAQEQLTVTNPRDQAVGVQISAGPYRSPQPELNVPSAESWLHFEPARFTLAPGASTTVRIRIEPPEAVANDTAGEYLAAILVDQLPAEESKPAEGSRLSIVPRLALPVYLQMEGRQRVQVELADVSLKSIQGMAQSGAPPQDFGGAPELLRIDTALRNRGSVHVRLTGTYALFRESGEMVRSGPLGRTVPILASAALNLPTLLPLPAPGKYKLALTFSGAEQELLQREIPFEIAGDGRITQEKK